MPTKTFALTINGQTMPPCSEDGYSVTRNKIWSKNTGRTASGLMVGDIVARKYTLSITWKNLTQAQVSAIKNAIDSTAFFSVTFPNEKKTQTTKTFYAADPTYPVKTVKSDNTFGYSDVSIELIER